MKFLLPQSLKNREATAGLSVLMISTPIFQKVKYAVVPSGASQKRMGLPQE